jgi:hypothetical protein
MSVPIFDKDTTIRWHIDANSFVDLAAVVVSRGDENA